MNIKDLYKIVYAAKFYSCWNNYTGYRPALLRLLVTSRCNSRCVMCNIWKLAKEKPEVVSDELSTQEWTNLIGELSEMGTRSVFISGGEPLLREDISDIIRCAKEKKMHVEMVNNGMLVTEAKAEELVASGLDIINFSIDGHTPEIHDKLRGVKGNWERTLRAIRFINLAKDKFNVKTPSISVSYTFSNINYQHIGKMVELKSELGFDTLQFNPITGKTTAVEELYLTNDNLSDLEAQLDILRTEFRNAGLPISPLSRPHAVCKEKEGAVEGRYAELLNKRVVCFRPWTEILVDPFGNVYPCGFTSQFQNLSDDLEHGFWGPEDYCMGNIRDSSISQIWNGEKYYELRKRFKEIGPLPMCSWCLCRSASDAVLTGLFKDRSLLLSIISSKIRQFFKRSEDFEWEFLYK